MDWKTLGRGWLVVLVACAALGFATTAAADRSGERARLVVFGDSMSDPGNAFVLLREAEVPPFDLVPDAPYARGGLHFSNGETWVEQLAVLLDARLSAGPALVQPLVFSNYAVGGTRARACPQPCLESCTCPHDAFKLGMQVQLFLADAGGKVSDEALYVMFVGGNDVRDALEALADDPNGDVSTAIAIMEQALDAIHQNLSTLYGAGARHFLVANIPNLALLPAVRLQGPAAQGAAQMLTEYFNTRLAGVLAGLEANLDVRFTRLDVYSILSEVVAAPATVGLTEVEQPCITPGTNAKPFCTHPDDYLFWDGIHPTRAGHRILALRANEVLGVTALAAHGAE